LVRVGNCWVGVAIDQVGLGPLGPTRLQSGPGQAMVGLLIIWIGLGPLWKKRCGLGRPMGDPLLAGFKMEQICTKKLCIITTIMYKVLAIILTNWNM